MIKVRSTESKIIFTREEIINLIESKAQYCLAEATPQDVITITFDYDQDGQIRGATAIMHWTEKE